MEYDLQLLQVPVGCLTQEYEEGQGVEALLQQLGKELDSEEKRNDSGLGYPLKILPKEVAQ